MNPLRSLPPACALALIFVSGALGRVPPKHRVQHRPLFDAAAVNDPQTEGTVGPGSEGSKVVRAQILLDRSHFSPGEIDGRYGDDLKIAILAYQEAHGMQAGGKIAPVMWKALDADSAPLLVPYKITEDDEKGPFDPVPPAMMEQAQLKTLGYQSPQEELGERFHISPKLLALLNLGKDLTKAGEELMVPNVTRDPLPQAQRVAVSKKKSTVTAYSPDNSILAQYPATIGSVHDPLPIGEWKVAIVQQNPAFFYNPDLFWDAKPEDSKARIAPGPNNPVGVVWIGLSKEHYGIHGTPEPGQIGHVTSHGCIRLTNWDAEELSHLVKRGTPVSLEE